jgi:endogenous inhibitor of DNA gyrase (YacG/DUF329 family)
MTEQARIHPCPQCKKPVRYDNGNPWRPFCSERCKLIDLGQWASESYQLPANPVDDD